MTEWGCGGDSERLDLLNGPGVKLNATDSREKCRADTKQARIAGNTGNGFERETTETSKGRKKEEGRCCC